MARLPPLRVDRYARLGDFLAAAGAYLQAREAEHNLMLGIAGSLGNEPGTNDEARPLLATVMGGERVVAAAVRTPPRNPILSEVDEPAAVEVLADALAGEELPGVVGPPEAVRLFAERWTGRTGDGWEVQLRERIFRLRRVVAPRPTTGVMRSAERADRDLVVEWIVAFEREALPEDSDAAQVAESVDDSLAGIGRRIFLWEDAEPVSLVAAGGATPNGIRIGPVYTPPRFRGRGYASALTAAVSQAMLNEGRRFCFLYTDLANPTSNKTYTAIGYEPVTDALMVAFMPPRAA
jgi:predicted GNAT family acetyltransferase